MSTGRVFHSRIALGKKLCIALNLHISCLRPFGAGENWFKVGCSRYGNETISDMVQHQRAHILLFNYIYVCKSMVTFFGKVSCNIVDVHILWCASDR